MSPADSPTPASPAVSPTKHTFTIPEGTWGLGLIRHTGADCWMYEPVRYVAGPAGVNRELRTLAAIGGLAADPGHFRGDL